MTTGLELDTFRVLSSIARNTNTIAAELAKISGMLELIYKNGVHTKTERK